MNLTWSRIKYGNEELRYKGLEVVYIYEDPEGHEYYIERVHGKKSRRKQWVIVDRASTLDNGGFGPLYKPKVAGPFKSLRDAKAALLMIMRFDGVKLS